MKYFSLFSGIGGFEAGIEKVIPDAECVGFSEVDKYAIEIYKRHFPKHKNYGDATKIKTKELPDFDFLASGFPCQSFSVAGKQRGFNDTRGTLFFEIARVLRDKNPRTFVLENVKGLVFHDKGKTIQTILGILSDLGYFVEWQVLNSKDFGLPQSRERIFLVGRHIGDFSGRTVFPITNFAGANPKELTQGAGQAYRAYGIRGTSPTLPTSCGGNHEPKIAVRSVAIPVLTPDRMKKRQNGRRFKTDGEPAFTLTAQDRRGVYDGLKIRKLTPLECERLQGFPDLWTDIEFKDKSGKLKRMSDSQRYKTLGNAVSVNVVEAIMEKMIEIVDFD